MKNRFVMICMLSATITATQMTLHADMMDTAAVALRGCPTEAAAAISRAEGMADADALSDILVQIRAAIDMDTAKNTKDCAFGNSSSMIEAGVK